MTAADLRAAWRIARRDLRGGIGGFVVFLASRACQLTHHNYSACAGRFARVFVGLGEGWLAKAGSVPNAEDIAAHLGEISATEPFSVPASIVDEVVGICSRLGIAA